MLQVLLGEIDLYCERTTSAFWAEPVNALTNLAFVIAGLWSVTAVRRHRAGAFAEVLAWWVVAIGIGSALFHTFANELTKWADILPIAGFTLAYTLMNLRRFLVMRWSRALPVFFAFYAAAGLATWLIPDWLRSPPTARRAICRLSWRSCSSVRWCWRKAARPAGTISQPPAFSPFPSPSGRSTSRSAMRSRSEPTSCGTR